MVDERVLLCDALKHTMGEARLPEIKTELEKRIARGELIDYFFARYYSSAMGRALLKP